MESLESVIMGMVRSELDRRMPDLMRIARREVQAQAAQLQRTYTLEQAARLLNLSRETVRRKVKAGEFGNIPHRRGAKIIIPRENLQLFLGMPSPQPKTSYSESQILAEIQTK